MRRNGTYSKRHRRITQPVTPIPPGHSSTPEADTPVRRGREPSGGVVFVNKTAGWIVAVLLVVLIVSVAYVGTSIFTREHQVERLRESLQQQELRLENLRAKQLDFELRLVQLETDFENQHGQ